MQATSDRQIRLGLSKCLGELGAIDPGKLDLHNDEYSSKGKILHDLPKHVYDVKEKDVQVVLNWVLTRSIDKCQGFCGRDDRNIDLPATAKLTHHALPIADGDHE